MKTEGMSNEEVAAYGDRFLRLLNDEDYMAWVFFELGQKWNGSKLNYFECEDIAKRYLAQRKVTSEERSSNESKKKGAQAPVVS